MMRTRAYLICLISVIALVYMAEPGAATTSVSLKLEDGRTIKLYDRSYALVVGTKDYAAWPTLPGVGDDVNAVKAVLQRHGFEVQTLLNPTRRAFDETIRDFIGNYGQDEGNRLLFYFAGHGHTLTTQRGRQLGYIIPSDTPLPDQGVGAFKRKAISMLEMEIYAKQIESKHALFMFDSCFSGSLFEITRAVPASISEKTARAVRQFITAGTAEQQVPDISIFRRQFVLGLKGEADLNTDGFITGSELASFLEDKVTNYSRRAQTPQYGKIRDPVLDKGDFVFVAPKKAVTTVTASTAPTGSTDDAAFELAYWGSIKASDDPADFKAYLLDYPRGRFRRLATLAIKRLDTTTAPIQQAKSQEPKGFKKQPASEAYKIAILPWKILTSWAPQEKNQIVFAGAEQAISGQSNRIRLEYSFHRAFPAGSQSKVIDKSIVSKKVAKKIWKGSKPNLDLVIDVGKKLGVNGVLLCRFYVISYGLNTISCYAIEVSSKRSFKAKRETTHFTSEGLGAVQSAIEEVLEKMLNAGSARTFPTTAFF
ncbi:MAG: caspase domain-containing protein [Gammaproteobacteria bacterium]